MIQHCTCTIWERCRIQYVHITAVHVWGKRIKTRALQVSPTTIGALGGDKTLSIKENIFEDALVYYMML